MTRAHHGGRKKEPVSSKGPPRNSTRLLFTSDVHGNLWQIERCLKESVRRDRCAIVLGGDLSPKGPHRWRGPDDADRNPGIQRRWYRRDLFPLIRMYARSSGPVFLMMGNDDFKANMDVLMDGEKRGLFNRLDRGPHEIDDDLYLIGYPYVTLTPFLNKDWEKWDQDQWNILEQRTSIRLDGWKSSPGGTFRPVLFSREQRMASIENDLEALANKITPSRTIVCFHDAPFGTPLDMIRPKKGIDRRSHIGSIAIRDFIRKHRPRATLHGHIHETVEVSRHYRCRIGRTLCAAASNFYNTGRREKLTYNTDSVSAITVSWNKSGGRIHFRREILV